MTSRWRSDIGERMVDAAARALCRSRYLGAIEWDRLQPHEQRDFRLDAREALLAALEARLEATRDALEGSE